MVDWATRYLTASARPNSTHATRASSSTARRWSSMPCSNASDAKTALLATKGFRDVLEIGRGNRTQPFNLRFHREPRSSRASCVRDRRAYRRRGPGQNAAGRRGARSFGRSAPRRNGWSALAISFLNSYLKPEHEQAAAAELRRLLPGRFRHDRHRTDARVARVRAYSDGGGQCLRRPAGEQYIAEFDTGLRQQRLQRLAAPDGLARRVISAERGCREPITLVESGPVGGCIGAANYGQLLGVDNLVAFDMGGTTAKCAMIERGRYRGRIDLSRRRARCAASRSAATSSTSSRSASAADRSHGSTTSGGSTSGRAARARCRARPATAAAAPSRPSPTPISCLAGSTRATFSAAK